MEKEKKPKDPLLEKVLREYRKFSGDKPEEKVYAPGVTDCRKDHEKDEKLPEAKETSDTAASKTAVWSQDFPIAGSGDVKPVDGASGPVFRIPKVHTKKEEDEQPKESRE